MKGSKLVSDYLTDRHRSLNEKRSQMVVEDADGRIIWLAGERTDNRFRVGAATTEVLIITLAQND
jgi:tRNA(Ile)-lysidine synthase